MSACTGMHRQKSLHKPFSFYFDLLWEMDSSGPRSQIPELKQSSCFTLLRAKAKLAFETPPVDLLGFAHLGPYEPCLLLVTLVYPPGFPVSQCLTCTEVDMVRIRKWFPV